MRILIAGICGFTGTALTHQFLHAMEGVRIFGVDNLIRPGSEGNRALLLDLGVEVFHGDVRMPSDVEALPAADWVIDAAANPSVLAGIDGRSSSRQLVEHNLHGTLNLLEYCKRHKAGFILLSSSRVYSITALTSLPMRVDGCRFTLDTAGLQDINTPPGVTAEGIAEQFPVTPPVSLYGATKLASETLALEYGYTFDFPVWVNRCGVLAGAGQFGTAAQGIFSYWMHAHAARRPLRFIGFGGTGYQVRDAFHPDDLAALLLLQMRDTETGGDRIFNVGGGAANAMSLAGLTAVCDGKFGAHAPEPDAGVRAFDVPWIVMDAARAQKRFGWRVRRSLADILDEIAAHAHAHPEWLDLSEGKRV